MRQRLFLSLCLLAMFACSCGGSKDSHPELSQSDSRPGAPAFTGADGSQPGSFPAALPDEGSFNPSRVTALASLSQSGSSFDSSSSGVTVNGELADFSGQNKLEWAIWRFEGAPADSVAAVSAVTAQPNEDADIWYGIADYQAGEWSWMGNGSLAAQDFELGGAAGQHSSPAGYIYVAVVSSSMAPFAVQSVGLTYSSRYSISGTVVDDEGLPVAGVLVTTNLADPLETFTDSSGNYAISGIPEGNWAVMVSAYGYRFHGDMQFAAVSGADVTGLDFWGIRDFTLLLPEDSHEPNNEDVNAVPMGGDSIEATLSVYNDSTDFYSFDVPAPGWYRLRVDAEESVLFPSVNLLLEPNTFADFSSSVLRGVNYCGHYLPIAGTYIAEVSLEGGGGAYELAVEEGQLSWIDGRAFDDNDENFEGEEYEEPYAAVVELAFAGFSMQLCNSSSGYFEHDGVPPLPAVISVSRPGHVYTPASYEHDFSLGPLEDIDFDVEQVAIADPDEPNDDIASATPLSLPLAEPYEAAISFRSSEVQDNSDYYSFTVAGGTHLMMRARAAGLFAEEYDVLSLRLYDSAEQVVDCQQMNSVIGPELRSLDPLPAGTYYIEVDSSDDGITEYSLLVREFDPLKLTFRTLLGGEPLDGVTVNFYLEDIGFYDDDEIGGSGESEVFYSFMEGERVFYTFSRFGLDIHESGGYVEFGNADMVVEPVIGYDGDSNEPNDTLALAKPLSYPVDVSATLHGETDNDDYYEFDTASRDIRVTLTTLDETAEFNLRLYKKDTFTSLSTGLIVGSGECYLRTDESGGYALSIYSIEAQGEYRLQIEDSLAYSISGTIDHGKPGESYYSSPIINLTTLDIVSSNGVDGDYILGYYPPGTYSVIARMANHTMNPGAPVDVVITNADVVLDFTATYSNQDALEPNNTEATAAAIALPADFTATTDQDNTIDGEDSRDWYTFTASGNGLLRVTVLRNWLHPPDNFYFDLREDGQFGSLARSKAGGTNNLNEYLEYPVEAGKQYLIQLFGSGDNRYRLQADITLDP